MSATLTDVVGLVLFHRLLGTYHETCKQNLIESA